MPVYVLPQVIKTTLIAAGTVANTVVKGAPGTYYGVLLSSVGVGTPGVFDNATTNTGTPVGQLAASAPLGAYPTISGGVPCVNGITVAGGATNPAMTVLWS